MNSQAKRSLLLLAVPALAGVSAAPVAASDPSPAPAGASGTVAVSLRYRLERVDDDAPQFSEPALASTLRTTLSYRTPALAGFTAFLEVEDVSDLGFGEDHANGATGDLFNGVTDRPTIADPDGTEMNAVSVRYAGLPDTTITVGRQELSLADERYLGPVGWRQNHQSFDAFHIRQASVPRLVFDYSYIDNVNRTVGDNRGMKSHVLDIAVDAGPAGTVAPYYYVLDYDDAGSAGLSTASLGVRLTGTLADDESWSFPYHAEFARQRDAGDNPAAIDADYLRLEARAARDTGWFGAGYERLGGAPGKGAFSTPLATLHKFNGWADKLTTTPSDGIEDLYISAGLSRDGLSLTGAVHGFGATTGGANYGREIDVQLVYRAPWKQSFAAKAAWYDADAFAADTLKVWLFTSYAF